jgi:hypothetical protein
MPTIFWFLKTLAVLALLAYAAMAALVWAVEPRQTDFSEPVAIDMPERPVPATSAATKPVQPVPAQ